MCPICNIHTQVICHSLVPTTTNNSHTSNRNVVVMLYYFIGASYTILPVFPRPYTKSSQFFSNCDL